MAGTNEAVDKIVVFRSNDIRREFWHGEWWFVINDVVAALTNSTNVSQYLANMRNRDPEISILLGGSSQGGVQNEHPLELTFDTAGGRQKMKCLNTEGNVSTKGISRFVD
jgi:prophage antirepressor-like protein